MEISYEQIMKDLEKGKYSPVYFLAGDEPYYIDRLSEYISTHILTEEERAFNQMVVYGRDTDAKAVINLARRYPMMARNLVVIVREAQDLSTLEPFVHYFSQPTPSTILVINYKYKKLSSRLKVFEALKKNGIYYESKRLYEDKIPLWTEAYLKDKGYRLDPAAGMMIAEYLGNDLSRITGELEKLMIVLSGKEKIITTDHVENHIGISKEYNNFELTNALAKGDVLKANRIALHFGNNPKNNPFILTLTACYYFFSKLLMYHSLSDKSRQASAGALRVSPYFINEYETASGRYAPKKVQQIISLLREYDLKSKGFFPVSSGEGELLKEMIYKILH